LDVFDEINNAVFRGLLTVSSGLPGTANNVVMFYIDLPEEVMVHVLDESMMFWMYWVK
jgi:hypothetical protein